MTTGLTSLRDSRTLRAQTPSLLLLAVLAFTCGCRANCDLVEAELRHKDRLLDELKGELHRREHDIKALEVELEQTQRQCAKTGTEPSADSHVVYVKSIALGRLTGGYDDNPSYPGHEGLQVLVEPRDWEDQSVKAPGALHVEAYEVSVEGLKFPIGAWDIPYRELRRMWENPLIGSPAYRVILPWRTWPSTEKIRVAVQFTTPDGRKFEADKDIIVRVPDRPVRKHDQAEPLHMPKPVPAGPSLEPPRGKPDEPIPPPKSLERPAPAAPPEIVPTSYRPSSAPAAPAHPTGTGLAAPIGARPIPSR